MKYSSFTVDVSENFSFEGYQNLCVSIFLINDSDICK